MTDAQTAGARQLAHERLINFEWEVRVESLRLRVIEAQIALEAKLAEVRELTVQSLSRTRPDRDAKRSSRCRSGIGSSLRIKSAT